MLSLLVMEVSVPSSFTETPSVEAVQADQYTFWVILYISSRLLIKPVNGAYLTIKAECTFLSDLSAVLK